MKNGFIASSLLYGMLALFLVLMISTLYIFGNNKISMDKLKETALDKVGNVSNELNIGDAISIAVEKKDGDFVVKTTPSTDVELMVDWYKTSTNTGAGIKVSTGKILAGTDTSTSLECTLVAEPNMKVFAVVRDTTGAYKGELTSTLFDADSC